MTISPVISKNYQTKAESNVTIIFQARSRMRSPLVRVAYVLAFLAVAGYAIVTLRGPRGIAALVEKQHSIRQLEHQNQLLHQEIERRRERINRLIDNPTEQELEIRERLKLVQPRDKVYIIGSPDQKPAGK
jgi:cell division protein FtsB